MAARGRPLLGLSGVLLLALVCGVAAGQAGATEVCEAWRAEVKRRQVAERGEASYDVYDAVVKSMNHQTFLRVEGTTAILVAGTQAVTGDQVDYIHPMLPSQDVAVVHWVHILWAEDQNGRIIGMRRLGPNDPLPATLAFPIPNGTTQLTAYQHCNKHGSYKGVTLTIAPVQTVASPEASCMVALCGDAAQEPAICNAHVAEFSRLYEKEFKRATATDGNTNLWHKPSLDVNGNGTATVVVGKENLDGSGNPVYHPMVPSGSQDSIHFIEAIWVKDQAGTVIAMRDFNPTDPSPVTFTFLIPSGTTRMTAFAYCNKHGLFQGDVGVAVAAGQAAASQRGPTCGVRQCPQEPRNFARKVDCLALVAEAKRRQVQLNAGSPTAFKLPFTLSTENEEHSPYIVLEGQAAKVVVGKGAATLQAADPIHPMVADPSDFGAKLHYIDTIWVEDQAGKVLALRTLSPSESSPATMYFDIPVGTTSVQAYELCNKHGLFQGPLTAVIAANTKLGARAGCSIQQCIEGSAVSACQGFTYEFYRRTGSATALTDATGMNQPVLSLNGSTATIVVGPGAVPGASSGYIHPMNYSTDPLQLHFISHIFARDEMNNLVALCELLPSDRAATCTFQVPPGVKSLRPFDYCNRDGFYVGETVPVLQVDPTALRFCHRRECIEAQPSLSASALSNAAVEAVWDAQVQSTDRISTTNMCLQHTAVFSVRESALDALLVDQIEKLSAAGDSASDTARRLNVYKVLLPALRARGGTWHGLPEVMEHAGLDQASLRLDLLDEELMRFSSRTLRAGQEAFVEGLDAPISNKTEDLRLIDATFALDWGYALHKSLGAHYTIFYTPNFKAQVVEVALCAKTLGWMGIGWLDPNHKGALMNHTDMAVAFVKDGQAFVQDRFAFSTEEPFKDQKLVDQRPGPNGTMLNGENDLTLIPGALGVEGKEWCPDAKCNPGFSLVQFARSFRTGDAWDAVLPVVGPKVSIIFSFSNTDPTDLEMVQHAISTTGYLDLTWNKNCEPGTYFNDDRIECISCDRGTFRPASAAAAKCLQCPSGTYQELTGQAGCSPCKPNFTTAGNGAVEERACTCSGPIVGNLDGWYHVPTCGAGPTVKEDGTQASCAYLGECRRCPEGMICPGGFDLLPAARANVSAMGRVAKFCEEVSQSVIGNASCSSRDFCAEYLSDEACQHAEPLLKRGYSSFEYEGLTVFLCKEPSACPGGPPGTCGSRRDATTVACANCIEDSYKDDGVCTKCTGSAIVPFILVLVATVVGLAALAFMVNQQVFMRAGSATTAGILVGTMFSALQTLTTFSSLEIAWIEPMKSLLKVVTLLSFNLEVMRTDCLFGPDPDENYGLRLLVLPLCTVFLMTVLALKKLRRPSMIFKVDLCNTMGSIYSLFFIPIVLSFLAPFICYGHPSGKSSMISAPAVLCYEDPQHATMVALGIVAAIFLCCPFVGLVFYGTWRYNKDVSRQDTDALNMFRFLFVRFTPGAYYFGAIVTLRNLGICLVPIITGKDPALQVILLTFVLLFFMTIQLWVKPWRPDPSQLAVLDANIIDAVLTSGCILLLLCGALCTNFQASEASLQQVGIALFVVFVVVLCGAFAAALYQRFVPRPFYKWFITHHKGGAAAQARFLKDLLATRGSWSIFIDSDNLTDLDTLFDTVRCRTGTVVVYATSQVLRRPWCAGEIVVASKTGVKMLLVRTPDFLDPTEEELGALGEYLDASRTLLTSYGIGLEDVKASYEHLFDASTPCLQMPGHPGRRKFDDAVDAIMAVHSSDKAKLASKQEQSLTKESLESMLGTVVLTSDPADDEATAAAGILALKVQRELLANRHEDDRGPVLCVTVDYANLVDASFGQTENAQVVDLLCTVVANARAVLVMLSKGSMRSPSQLVVVVEAMMGAVEWAVQTPTSPGGADISVGTFKTRSEASVNLPQVIIPIQLPGFEFPTNSYYDEVLPHLWLGSNGAEEGRAVRTFFKRISMPFGTHASHTILSAQATDILGRIPPGKAAGGKRKADPKLPSRWHLRI